MTQTLPNSEGYYWWIQKFEGAIVVKRVVRVQEHKGHFYARDEEYDFIINRLSLPEEEFWQKIEEPADP